MIKPTIGRKIWYWPTPDERLSQNLGADISQALDASIAYVHNDRSINIAFNDAFGAPHKRQSVLLLQDDARFEPKQSYCAWMPYQATAAAGNAAFAGLSMTPHAQQAAGAVSG